MKIIIKYFGKYNLPHGGLLEFFQTSCTINLATHLLSLVSLFQ